jgi:hypothetical protein
VAHSPHPGVVDSSSRSPNMTIEKSPLAPSLYIHRNFFEKSYFLDLYRSRAMRDVITSCSRCSGL